MASRRTKQCGTPAKPPHHERRQLLITTSAGILGVTAWVVLEGILVSWLVLRWLSVVQLPVFGDRF